MGLFSAVAIVFLIIASFLIIPFALAWITGTDGLGTIFFFVFLILIFVCQSMYFGNKSANWPNVEGVIIGNEYALHGSKTNATLHLWYQYSV